MADPLLEYSKVTDDRSPESTIDNSTQRSLQCSFHLEWLWNFTHHTNTQLPIIFDCVSSEFCSFRIYFNPETQCYLVEICHAWNEGITPAVQRDISVRRNDFRRL
jgi:hypothetical protein